VLETGNCTAITGKDWTFRCWLAS